MKDLQKALFIVVFYKKPNNKNEKESNKKFAHLGQQHGIYRNTSWGVPGP
ncbi:25545_t:CDS:1, partial [Gigaspora rosea]